MTDQDPPTLFDVPDENPAHPAKYTNALLSAFVRMLRGSRRILDPFGGTGKIFLVKHWLLDVEIQAVEIEPEWAALDSRITLGDALALPWEDGHFDAICTSPTYGNRMADGTVDSDRIAYTSYIGRQLHENNSGSLQWGNDYREFHLKAWQEARRVLSSGGRFILNIKDHIRNFERQLVTDWHIETLESLGFELLEHTKINTPSMRRGKNSELRIPYESVIHFRRRKNNEP